MIKSKIFSRPLLLKLWHPINIGLKMESKYSFQFNFLRPSIYDLKTDENDPSFLSTAQKGTHHLTYIRFLQHSKPQNRIFANYKYTNPLTMTNLYTIDHSKITGYLRNYDSIKQYFVCFLIMIHIVLSSYLKSTLFILVTSCYPATFPLRLSNL